MILELLLAWAVTVLIALAMVVPVAIFVGLLWWIISGIL